MAVETPMPREASRRILRIADGTIEPRDQKAIAWIACLCTDLSPKTPWKPTLKLAKTISKINHQQIQRDHYAVEPCPATPPMNRAKLYFSNRKKLQGANRSISYTVASKAV